MSVRTALLDSEIPFGQPHTLEWQDSIERGDSQQDLHQFPAILIDVFNRSRPSKIPTQQREKMSTEVFEKLTNDEDMSHLQFGFFFHDLPRNLVQFASCRRRQLPNPPRDPSADQRVQTSHERRKLSPSNPPSDRKTWLRRCAGMLKKRTCVGGRAAQRVGEQRASPGFAVM